MRLFSESLQEGGAVPERCALAARDAHGHLGYGGNRSPHLAWEGVPPGAGSLVIVAHDPDAPACTRDIDLADREVPAAAARRDRFHWLLVDLDPTLGELAEGALADGVPPVPDGGGAPRGREGLNDVIDRLAGSAGAAQCQGGYAGPFPPWNDAVPHRFTVTCLALDEPQAPIADPFRGPDLLARIRRHVLAAARLTARYSLNPRVPAC